MITSNFRSHGIPSAIRTSGDGDVALGKRAAPLSRPFPLLSGILGKRKTILREYGRDWRISAAVLGFAFCTFAVESAEPPSEPPVAAGGLAASFLQPPLAARPMVYWMWVSGNISREGITRDLEHMKAVGIGGGLVFDVPALHGENYAVSAPAGPVAFMSDEWLALVNFAAEESHRLGLDLGVVLCSAWNTGGPWITAKDNNQRTASSLLRVTGPIKGPVDVPVPSTDPGYKDVAVLAFPSPANESHLMQEKMAEIHVNGKALNPDGAGVLMDSTRQSPLSLPNPTKEVPTVIEFLFREPVTIDRFYAQEDQRFGLKAGELEAQVDGGWRKLGNFDSDGTTPVIMEFEPVTTGAFRLTVREAQRHSARSGKMRLGKLVFLEPGRWAAGFPAIKNLGAKSITSNVLVKRRGESSLSMDHLIPTGNDPFLPVIDRSKILLLTDRLQPGGGLAWDVPEGDWVIQRFGMVPTGSSTYNAEGREGNEGALESDKMSAAASILHYEGMARKILDRLSPEGRKGLGFFHIDSWEVETHLWTGTFVEDFTRLRGYDPRPYLPVLEGLIVGDAETSDRFLWDYRRTIGDLDIRNHFQKLADLCHADGVKLSAQAAHGFQANMDAIACLSGVDYPSGEFWFLGRGSPMRDVRNSVKDASSTVNLYGKPYGLFESFTSGRFPNFWPAPYDMKKVGDMGFAEGVSRMFMHGLWHQPDPSDKPPGLMWSAGIHVGPSITWMPDGRAFFDYISRCQYLLQTGVAAKDVLYFYGDGMPNITPKRDELVASLPLGRDYDATDARTLRELVGVKDGILTVPHGSTYQLLVLPPVGSMLPETLEVIARLVREGATVVGSKPLRSPSLAGQPEADRKVQELADELWGENPGADGSKMTGQGTVHWGRDLATVFGKLGIPPQVEVLPANESLKSLHRRTTDGRDIYFLANQSDNIFDADILFRSPEGQAQLWQPDDGSIAALPDTPRENGRARVRLKLPPWGSSFVVFGQQDSALPPAAEMGGGGEVRTIPLDGPWEVSFEENRGAPRQVTFDTLRSWTSHDQPGIKFFSGYGTYRKTFLFPTDPAPSKMRVVLDLGGVGDVARVRVNGQDFGTLWKPPYRLDISRAVKPGNNDLEVAVVNTWVNRLIGDDQAPPENAVANTQQRKAIPLSDLEKHPSGLLGPVLLVVTDPLKAN